MGKKPKNYLPAVDVPTLEQMVSNVLYTYDLANKQDSITLNVNV